jgi:hypothetical protein
MLVKVVHPTQLSVTTEQTIPRMVAHWRLETYTVSSVPNNFSNQEEAMFNSSELLNITCEHTRDHSQ